MYPEVVPDFDPFEREGDVVHWKSQDVSNVSKLIGACYGISNRRAVLLLSAADGHIGKALDAIDDARARGRQP
jgi:hypothetical protein